MGEDVLERFGVDTRMVQLPPTHVQGVEIVDDGEYWAMWDRWGAKMRMPKDKPLYYDWVDFPIKELTLEALEAYQLARARSARAHRRPQERAEQLRATTDYALVGSAVIGGGIFEQSCRVMGMEPFMMSMLTEPEPSAQARRWHHRHLHRVGRPLPRRRSATSSTSSPSGTTWPPSRAG